MILELSIKKCMYVPTVFSKIKPHRIMLNPKVISSFTIGDDGKERKIADSFFDY